MPAELDQLAARFTPPLACDAPDVGEYFGLWAIEDRRFMDAVGALQGFNLTAHIDARSQQPAPRGAYQGDDYLIEEGGVAVIELRGPMMKYVSSLSGGTSTVRARREISNAAANPDVRAILLRIDSPGGTVAGTADLASAVTQAATRKPVHALIEDLGASAAYWVASQAVKVFAANATTFVGSIGTYAVMYDYSRRAEKLGLAVHVVKAGAFKGSGEPGTPITEEQLAEWQRLVNQINEHFVAGVQAGRRFSAERARELADGRVHVADDALGLGLIDAIQSYEQTLSQLRATGPRRMRMTAETPEAPKAATYQDLKAALPGASAEFLCEQMESGATLEQARSAHVRRLEADNARLRQESEAAKKEAAEKDVAAKAAAEKQAKKPGIEPLEEKIGAETASGDPAAEWNRKIDEQVAKGRTRQQAAVIVNRENPELRQAFVEAHNAAHRAH